MNDADLGRIVSSSATRYEAPPRLRRNIATALRDNESSSAAPQAKNAAAGWRKWSRLAAAFACGLAVAWIATSLLEINEASDRLAAEAVADHVRSMMVAHLTDVASSDLHTVKPWFNGKLTYSPPVRDLTADGFPLAGGRLDYLGGRPVAALVYRHRLHAINLFVMPCQGVAFGSKTWSREGFNVVGWCDDGMRYVAVSDLNAEELVGFTRLLGRAASP